MPGTSDLDILPCTKLDAVLLGFYGDGALVACIGLLRREFLAIESQVPLPGAWEDAFRTPKTPSK